MSDNRPTDLAGLMGEADRLAIEIMKLDAEMPGLAIETVRNIIRRLPLDDALALIGQPKPKPKPDAKPISVDSLIG